MTGELYMFDFEHNPDFIPEISSPPSENDVNQNGEEQETPKLGAITRADGKKNLHCLTVIGQIEGHYSLPANNKATRYEQIIPQLVAIEETPSIDGLLILLNTVGGDVEAGLAIAELISGMKKPTVSLVLGGGHSIGVPLAVSAKKSFIVPSATMTLHPVRMNGLVVGVPQTIDAFLRMQDRITDFVTSHSSVKRERFIEMLNKTGELVGDVGTILSGVQAVEEGVIDSIGTLGDALAALYDMIEKEKT